MSISNALLTCRFPLRPCSVKLLVAIVFVVPNVIAVPAISGHAGEITLPLDDQQNDAQPPSQNSDSNKEDSAEKDSAEADSNPPDSGESNQAEQEDVCRPVIKVLVRRRENSEVAALRRTWRTESSTKSLSISERAVGSKTNLKSWCPSHLIDTEFGTATTVGFGKQSSGRHKNSENSFPIHPHAKRGIREKRGSIESKSLNFVIKRRFRAGHWRS